MSGVRAGSGFTPTDAQHWATKAYVDSKAGSGGGTAAGVPTYVQQTDPGLSTGYVWYQTDASGNVVNVWVNVPAQSSAAVADNFNRADGAVGSTSTGSKAWSSPSGTTWAISSQQLQCTAVADSTAPGDITVDCGSADGTVSGKIYTTGSLSGLCFRVAGTNDATGYLFWNNAGTYTLSKRTAVGSYTQLGTSSGAAAAAGDTLSVTMSGSSITCKVNGATAITATDASSTGTRHGFWAYSNPMLFDDFSYATT